MLLMRREDVAWCYGLLSRRADGYRATVDSGSRMKIIFYGPMVIYISYSPVYNI